MLCIGCSLVIPHHLAWLIHCMHSCLIVQTLLWMLLFILCLCLLTGFPSSIFSINTVDPWPFKMGPMGCTEMSVNNYHSTLREIPKDRRSYFKLSWKRYHLVRFSPTLWSSEDRSERHNFHETQSNMCICWRHGDRRKDTEETNWSVAGLSRGSE
jgi:hypothetical protein